MQNKQKFNFLLTYNVSMANIKLEDLYLSKEESRVIIELLAKKRNIINYKLDQAINYIISLTNNLKIKIE